MTGSTRPQPWSAPSSPRLLAEAASAWRSTLSPSPQRITAIDHEGGPGDIARSRRCEIDRKRTNFLWVAGATHRNRADERLNHLRIFLGPGLVGLGHEEAGRHGVNGDSPPRPVGGRGAREMDDRGLRCFI